MLIEIYGPGCPRCRTTAEEIEKVVRVHNVDAEVRHVTDMAEILKRGILATPAVFIDGEKKSQGKVPKAKEIAGWLGMEE